MMYEETNEPLVLRIRELEKDFKGWEKMTIIGLESGAGS